MTQNNHSGRGKPASRSLPGSVKNGGYARADSTRTITLSDFLKRSLRTGAGGGPDPLSLLARIRASSRYEHRHTRNAACAPLFVTAAGMPAADAAELVQHMSGRYRLPDALRRADTLARVGQPAAMMTGRQPG
jgi:hypothetical protein